MSVFSGVNLGEMESCGTWLDAQRDTLTHILIPEVGRGGWILMSPKLVAGWMSWGPSSVRPQSWGVRGDLGTEQSPWMCSWPRCHMASRAGAAGASGEQPGMC